MNNDVGEPACLHGIAAVFSHPLAVGAARGAVRYFTDDLFDVAADPVRRYFIQNSGIRHHFPSFLRLTHVSSLMYDNLLYDKKSNDREGETIMTNVLRLTEHPPLRRDQAFERLRDAIITGHFAPGARLIERELCEAMGVSRTSIREVLRRLEAEQLIESDPRRGPMGARLSRKQVEEIYDVRALLEAAVVRRLALEASIEDISELRRIYDKLSVVREQET